MPILSHSQTTVQGGAGRGLALPEMLAVCFCITCSTKKTRARARPERGCGKLSRHSDQNHNHEVPDHRRTTDSGKISVIGKLRPSISNYQVSGHGSSRLRCNSRE